MMSLSAMLIRKEKTETRENQHDGTTRANRDWFANTQGPPQTNHA